MTGEKEEWLPKSRGRYARRQIPIHPEVARILKRRWGDPAKDGQFVFPPFLAPHKYEKVMRLKLIRVTKVLGIPDFTRLHLFRHFFVSRLCMAGAPEGTVRDIVGHVDDETLEIYRHTTIDHRARFVRGIRAPKLAGRG